MANVTYNIKGVKEAVALIEKKYQTAIVSIKDQLDLAATYLTKEIKASINGERNETRSVKTGNFYRSILPRRISDTSTVVETNVPYAPSLEYGTTTMAPRKHFRNTVERTRPLIKQVFKIKI